MFFQSIGNFFRRIFDVVRGLGNSALDVNEALTSTVNNPTWLLGSNLEIDSLQVRIKVYATHRDREDGANTIEEIVVSDLVEFDKVIADHSFPARYFAFESASIGVVIKGYEQARYILSLKK